MTNLFTRAAIFTDLHLGYKSNSAVFNADCEAYMDWFIKLVKQHTCDAVLFLGDFHHNRNSINIQTMDTSLRLLEKLDSCGTQVYFIPGNHDLYHKDKRTISSVKYIDHFQNIHLINEQFTDGNVTFVPWLIGEEYKNMRKIKSQYVMGHFELPHFKMNAMVEMPDHGELKSEDFENVGLVFTGHFHKRQKNKNVHYIGNAFPHNFADAWDDDRGAVILDWGQDPVYHNWTAGPKYRTLGLGRLIDEADTLLDARTYVKVQIDIPISYEEANFIKEQMQEKYNVREISLITNRTEVLTEGTVDTESFESVDQIVLNQIQSLDTNHYDTRLLTELYVNL